MINVQIVNKSNNPMPEYKHKGDAGMDLRAFIEDGTPIVLKPLERKMIHTGLYMALPDGIELQVRPRSGLAIKNGITVINTPGTVDSKYRDEICVLLVNLSNEDFTINSGDRIAQGVFNKYEQAEYIEVEELDKTDDRGGGFGHSGVA